MMKILNGFPNESIMDFKCKFAYIVFYEIRGVFIKLIFWLISDDFNDSSTQQFVFEDVSIELL